MIISFPEGSFFIFSRKGAEAQWFQAMEFLWVIARKIFLCVDVATFRCRADLQGV
jgi:hypothetical protein